MTEESQAGIMHLSALEVVSGFSTRAEWAKELDFSEASTRRLVL